MCFHRALLFVFFVAVAHAWSHESIKSQPNLSLPPPPVSLSRRQLLRHNLLGIVSTLALLPPSPARASEWGDTLTRAVTESDVGITVRRSVVRGAQVLDGLDQTWEQWSDALRLGSARSQRDARPSAKDISPPLPLDSDTAQAILARSDDTFVAASRIAKADLQQQIQKVSALVQPSFQRAGLTREEMVSSSVLSREQFNFLSYVHYKAYSDLLVARQIDFVTFRKSFDTQLGQHVLAVLLPDHVVSRRQQQVLTPSEKRRWLASSLESIQTVCQTLVRQGFASRIDPPVLEEEKISDWCDDLSDLTWNLAVDADVTLGAQILLQEQGFRLYPNYVKYAILNILDSIPGQQVAIEDYYLDTDYNPDPNKFKVKEVLLNIVLESA